PRRFPAGGIYSLLCLLSPPPRAWGISSTGVEGSVLASPPRPSHSPARPKCNGGGSLITPFLTDRGYRLEIDLTNSESARSIFLIVAESRSSLIRSSLIRSSLVEPDP